MKKLWIPTFCLFVLGAGSLAFHSSNTNAANQMEVSGLDFPTTINAFPGQYEDKRVDSLINTKLLAPLKNGIIAENEKGSQSPGEIM